MSKVDAISRLAIATVSSREEILPKYRVWLEARQIRRPKEQDAETFAEEEMARFRRNLEPLKIG